MNDEVSGDRYLLDTNAVNIIVDYDAVHAVIDLALFITTTQLKELVDTKRDERREILLAGLQVLGPRRADTRSNYFDDTDWDEPWSEEDSLCDDILAEVVRLDLEANKTPRNPFNQSRDAQTIEVAIKEGMIFVTSDANAAKACRKFGGRTILTEDLIAYQRVTK